MRIKDFAWLALVAFMAFNALRGKLGLALSELLLTIVLLSLAAVLVDNLTGYMTGLSDTVDAVSYALLSVTDENAPADSDYVAETENGAGMKPALDRVQRSIFDSFVEQPYMYLNWGGPENLKGACKERAEKVLEAGMGHDGGWSWRYMGNRGENECGDAVRYQKGTSSDRFMGALLTAIESIILMVVFTMIALSIILAKFAMAWIFATAPIWTALAALPGPMRAVAWRPLVTGFKCACAICLLSGLAGGGLLGLEAILKLEGNVEQGSLLERKAIVVGTLFFLMAAVRRARAASDTAGDRLSESLVRLSPAAAGWQASPSNFDLGALDKPAAMAAMAPIQNAQRRLVERRQARRAMRNLERMERRRERPSSEITTTLAGGSGGGGSGGGRGSGDGRGRQRGVGGLAGGGLGATATTGSNADAEQWAGIIGLALVVPTLFLLAVGHLSALLFDGAFPAYALTDIPRILKDLAENLGNPGRAWDGVNHGGDPPGPVAFYGVFAALLVPVGFGARWAYENLTPKDGKYEFATWRDIKHLRSGRHKGDHEIAVGLAGRRPIVVHDLHSMLLVGPAHSGKTSSVVIPALLEWNGPAIVAASTSQVVHETIGWRSHLGEVHVFDPAATTRYARSGWSPLSTCGTWSGAIRTARDLTLAAKASLGAEADAGDLTGIVHSDLWSSSMATALAPFLLAAASSGRTILHAAEWIEREERDEVLEILRTVDRDAVRAHNTTFVRNDPGRSSFFHVMYQILSVYKDPIAADSADRHEIIPHELLDGEANTLYLTTPDYDQARFRPLCSTIVRQVLAAAYDKTARGRTLDAPLLLILDDAISVAPMNDLAKLASAASARGVQLVTVFQDFNQMEGEYGAQAGLVLKNHRVKLLLSGSQYIDAARNDRQLLRPKLGEQLHEGEGVLFYGTSPPVRLKLRQWFKDKELKQRAETSQDILPPSDPGRSRSAADQRQALQVQAWMARHVNPEDDTMEGPIGPLGRVDPTRSFADLLGTHEESDNLLPENVTRLPHHRPKRQ